MAIRKIVRVGDPILRKTSRPVEEIRSDYIQMGHHGQGGPDKDFYDAVDAKNAVRLWPTPEWVWNNAQSYAIGQTRSWLDLPYEAKDFQKEKMVPKRRQENVFLKKNGGK